VPATVALARLLLDRDGSMRPFISILAVAACLFPACTTTHTIRRPATAEELQSLVWKKRDHITLLKGDPEGSTSPVPRSLAPAAPPPEGDADVPMVDLSNLRGYEVKRRGVGALEGLGLGTALGFLAGAVVGSAMGTDRSCQNVDEGCVELSSSNMALIIGLLGAVVGHATGPLIGAAVGHTDRYIFSNESARP
jgi:hypothetical protein